MGEASEPDEHRDVAGSSFDAEADNASGLGAEPEGTDAPEAVAGSLSDLSDRPSEVSDVVNSVASERSGVSETDSLAIRAYLETKSDEFLRSLGLQLEAMHSGQVDLPTRQHMDMYTPHPEWFIEETLLHGRAHHMRVVMLVKLVSELVESELPRRLSENEEAALARAASLHDARRSDDGDDLRHGLDAAAFARELNQTVPYEQGINHEIDMLSQWIMVYHLADDSLFDNPREKDARVVFLMKIFKDADAWDRYRDTEGPDIGFIRFKETISQISAIAEAFAEISGTLLAQAGENWPC